MSDSPGTLCLVLHAHLPYVLHHGSYPHGEAWLYEAAAETYLPLLETLDEVSSHRARPGLTIGLTPVLLEQLAHPRFKAGFVAYLNERIDRAQRDRREFEKKGDEDAAFLAERWEKWYARRLVHFEKIDRDIIAPFAAHWRAGHIQMLTSNATHAYMPLMVTDECSRAQMVAGTHTSERHLGQKSRGMWLPECGYRPANAHWKPAVLWDDARYRPGVESYLADAGVEHFFIDSPMLAAAAPLGAFDHGHLHSVSDAQTYWDKQRGWRDPLFPAAAASTADGPRCVAMARHPRVSEQVWSNIVGYPAAGEYLDFHRRHGDHGLRYHRITSLATSQEDKQPYAPEDTFTRLYDHSQHFCQVVRETLSEHQRRYGRPGVVVAPFDAELFGHWWFEGPSFLRNVLFTLARDKSVKLATAEEALRDHPPSTVVKLSEGSWGKNGDHSVWLNDQTRWMWEAEYRAEVRMLGLLRVLPWQSHRPVRAMMERAGRQLLLMQASDWPFVVHSQNAVDYGIQRFAGHATRFDRLTAIAEALAAGRPIDPLQQVQIDEADAHDDIFAEIDLGWWAAGQPRAG